MAVTITGKGNKWEVVASSGLRITLASKAEAEALAQNFEEQDKAAAALAAHTRSAMGEVTFRVNTFGTPGGMDKAGNQTHQKGGISVVGLGGRFPTTLYALQWVRLLRAAGATSEAVPAFKAAVIAGWHGVSFRSTVERDEAAQWIGVPAEVVGKAQIAAV